MAIDWGQFKNAESGAPAAALLIENFRPDNYGKGDGEWCLTEILNARSGAASSAIRYIEGVDSAGKPIKGRRGALRMDDGRELVIKLRVLSRQACTEDSDGKGINTWDTTETDAENYNNEFCPEVGDKPLTGDVVWVKGDARTHDPVTGEPLTKRFRLALVARMEAKLGRKIKPALATHYQDKYTVDKDGCIVVPYVTALQLLSLKGRGLVLPQFKGGAKRGDKVKSRRITNWLFEEVCKGDEKPKRRKPKDKPPVVDPTATVN